MNNSLQRTSSNVGSLVDRTITSGFVVFDFQVGRHGEPFGVLGTGTKHEQQWSLLGHCSDMNRAFPCSLYTHLVSRSRALSIHPKKRGLGGIPPLLGLFLGKWSPWFECPLTPVSPSRSFLPWGLVTEHGSTAAAAAATVFRWSSRRRRPGKWNPSVEVSLAPDTPCSFFLCSFHLGASTSTTTTIVTTPRHQATTGNHFFMSPTGTDFVWAVM